jgi:hypothetical protein
MKIQYVPQKDPAGCAVACMSMVTRIPYDKVKQHFLANFDKDGLHPDHTREFVCNEGFSAIETLSRGYNNLASNNKHMARPFADVHIVTVQQKVDSRLNHAIVMDRKGRIYDPENPKLKDLSHYYYIVRVTGFWKD